MKSILAIFLFCLLGKCLLADGGVVLARHESGPLQATVFANPFPVRAGPTDFSVLLQDGSEPVLDAEVRFSLTQTGPSGEIYLAPCCTMQGADGALPATRNHSRNKMLFSTMMTLPSSGKWELGISVKRSGNTVSFVTPLNVQPPPRPLESWWPFLATLPAAILLYVWRTRLQRRRVPSASGP